MVKHSKENLRHPLPAMPRVLVVDDDPEELAFACKALGSTCIVMAATCADDAVRMARSSTPHVIVMDVIMHGNENGFTVFRILGEDPVTAKIPVIFLTNVNETTGLSFGPEEVSRYLGRKPVAFLEKPVSAAALIREVVNAASRHNGK
jgi:putative two-component system response regulator